MTLLFKENRLHVVKNLYFFIEILVSAFIDILINIMPEKFREIVGAEVRNYKSFKTQLWNYFGISNINYSEVERVTSSKFRDK